MIVTCPSCDTSYFADDDTIARDNGRLTCPACGHGWMQETHSDGSSSEALMRGAHERYLEAVRLKRKRRSRTTAMIVWMVVATLFASGAAAAVYFRDDVARQWPQSASAFAALGLDVNRFGVDFENIERTRELRGTVPVLSVSADVRNVSRADRPAPRVRVGLFDDFGREIAHLVVDVEPATIPQGEAGRFSAILENPPADSYSLDIRFVDPSEGADP